jgi:hypothetical protein
VGFRFFGEAVEAFYQPCWRLETDKMDLLTRRGGRRYVGTAILALLAAVPLAFGATCYHGELYNDWTPVQLNTNSDFGGGNYCAATITATNNDTFCEFKFSDGETFWWGAGTVAGKNATIGTADHSGAGNLSLANVSNTYRYTFRIKDPESYWLRDYVVMETAGDPVVIGLAWDQHIQDPATSSVPVNLQLSAAKSPQENLWVRYTADGWSASTLLPASGSSTNYAAAIPAPAAGTRIEYYALTSTMPSNQITSDFDLCTLRGKKSGSTNYGFRFGAANAWHIPGNAEPSGAFMRNPPTNGVQASNAVYVYNGNQFQGSGNAGDQSAATLCHRLKGAATWTATNGIYDSTSGNNKYWQMQIPGNTYGATNEVEYYIKVGYNDHNTTCIGTTNGGTTASLYLIETNAQHNAFSFTYGLSAANLGNGWHIPTNREPFTATMRNPFGDADTNQDVYVYSGNQYQGPGSPGDQSGGTLYHRLVGAGSWSATNLSYDNIDGNNNYWKSRIPAGTFGRTNEVEYYLKITYTDHDDTFIGTTNSSASSVTYATETAAQTNSFRFTYFDAAGSSAAWLWHADNRVVVGSNVQCWVKIGYADGIGSNRWVDYAAIYYTTNGADPQGAYGIGTNASTKVQMMIFDHMEEDIYPSADAMWWMGALAGIPIYVTVKYRISAYKATNGVERFADYGTTSGGDRTFSFALGTTGTMQLTVGGRNADYTTTKFWINESSGESQMVDVIFAPGAADVDKAEMFCNLDRRDYCEVDYTNAWITADGYPDGIKPPDGNFITTNDTGAYFVACPMTALGGGQYVWTGRVSRTGAYRLTARYTTNGMAANTWHWYSSGGRRDHAIVVSPKKVLDQAMYELNALTVESTDSTEANRSTFVDLLGAAEGDTDGFDPFNLDYLNFIQANCLWFQPIHPNAQERKDSYTPGSPYATRNYFAVSKYYGSATSEESAMAEFTNFVAKCDAYTGSVGTINVMLDGVFNHTSWDAVFGEGGTNFGFCTNANDRIGWFKPGWYALITDYGLPATYYHGAYDNDYATAPDRGDFGKWFDVAELYFGKYSALVRHNPDNNGDYLNEGDTYDFADMVKTNEMDLWRYFAYYTEFWLQKTGHATTNSWVQAQDDKGIDGLRCDFGQGLPPQIWEYIINRTRKMKWNFMFMAETLDGGKPGYRSNRHFDILNESLVFQFTQGHINDSWSIRQALEDRRNAYSGGTILLNLTSHDEVLPDNDCWLVASRYGALSTVDGIPMLFYGQEQGIQNYNSDPSYGYYDGFRTDHEENFGKYIPNFKQWNQLMIWSNPPPNNTGLAQWYGRVNWARHNSPALRSQNRYFLSKVGGGDEGKILAVAKYERAYASPTNSDVVLAFALLFRHGEPHGGANATYNLQPVWDRLGLNTSRWYNVRNIASSDGSVYVWDAPQSGADLWNNGIYVGLGGGTTGNSITNDGELVQFLKVDEISVNHAPVLTVPGPHTVPVGSTTNFTVKATDLDGDPVVITNTMFPEGATFDGTNFAWTALPVAFVNTTNALVFVGNDQRGATNSAVTNNTTIIVPWDWDADDMDDGWEWSNFSTLTNSNTGDADGDRSDNLAEYIAGTNPGDSNSLFRITNITVAVNRRIRISTVPARYYTIHYVDGLSDDRLWRGFGNTNLGIGTWLETNVAPASFTFTDDETPDTTTNPPATGQRFYRVNVRHP